MGVSTYESASKPTTKTNEVLTVVADSSTPGPVTSLIDGIEELSKTNNAQQYVYQYGIKNISLSHSLYSHAGVFVTKPIEVAGNIMEVSLSTIEDHPSFNELDGMATDRMTSIEYYISTIENPTQEDWTPILPEGIDTVKCEKLFFKGSSAKLRFHANISDIENTRIYKDNILMDQSEWYFTERGASVQLSVAPNPSSMYTIDYIPDINLNDVHAIKVKGTDAERKWQRAIFPNGTDANNTIKLPDYPYVDYQAINEIEGYNPNTSPYRPIDVFLTNGNIATGDGKTQSEFFPLAYSINEEFVTINRTDYKNSTDPSIRKYSIEPNKEYKVVEYKQERNKLIFPESFNRSDLYYNQASNHGNASIEVVYQYLMTKFRLKIILRKNTDDKMVVTPAVNSYQLKFKVMR